VLASAAPGDDRPDVAGIPGLSGARHSGFHLAVPAVAGEVIVVAGRRADGTLLPLEGATNGVSTVVPGTEVLVDGATVPVGDATAGSVEQAERVAVPPGVRAARMPRPGRPADWNWLRVRAAEPLAAGSYSVGDPAGAGPIRFRILSDARRSIDVMVGACNQWYADEGGVEVVGYPAEGPVPTVELIG
jgi:hypothetical protein